MGPAADAIAYWIQFPAYAVAVDWSDHRAAHHAVMRLFADDLDGGHGRIRSHNDVLFRIDVLGNQPMVLVQSRVKPMLVPPQARTLVLSGRTWETAAGDEVRFRVAVNPIVRNGRAKTERVVRTDEVPGWVTRRLAPELADVTVLNHYRDTYQQKHRGRAIPSGDEITVDVVDGIATVGDPERLHRLRLAGVGRRKAYGAGLLTVQRIG
jgi:hypothetical protein